MQKKMVINKNPPNPLNKSDQGLILSKKSSKIFKNQSKKHELSSIIEQSEDEEPAVKIKPEDSKTDNLASLLLDSKRENIPAFPELYEEELASLKTRHML